MNRKGFTLIELLVVIAIISILLTISVINFSSWLKRQSIDRQVKEMSVDIMSMRQRAIVTGQNYTVQFPDAATLVFKRYSSSSDIGTEVQRKSLRFPVVLSTAGAIRFTGRGMMLDDTTLSPVEKVVCVFTDANPSTDALVITPTRVSKGTIINQGSKNAAACTKANIEIK
ncbi:MAG: prepilin-type N-terminal cleavage/methylation domain-containing protein [Geobacteraceae bacterium]